MSIEMCTEATTHIYKKANAFEFIDNAGEFFNLNDVPNHVIKAAYHAYNNMPVKSASLILKAHEACQDPEGRLALEIIGATMVKKAGAAGLGLKLFKGTGTPGIKSLPKPLSPANTAITAGAVGLDTASRESQRASSTFTQGTLG